ncbi:methyl-accepting chemotaxis protein [Desulfobulbus rhabdoformis]|uniref:methyl-accepting chemotaxis protein n=1 Tax=Desulfobulbus rhabdoformis TaxID=34032 RepID=UPI001F06CEF7|nr:methyl-accepting chemotaxis protein [Desulfobulbus rhabdoformis]
MKLVIKIGGGFGFILLLLLIVAAFSWRGFNKAATGIGEYDRRATNATVAAKIQEHMLGVRLEVKEYMINHTPSSREKYEVSMATLQDDLETTKNRIKNKERLQKITRIAEEVSQYKSAFAQLILDIQESDRIINSVLRSLGPSMQADLKAIMTSATQIEDSELVAKAAAAEEHMLLARLYAQRFLATATSQDADLVVQENKEMQQLLQQIMAENPGQRKAAENILADTHTYIEAFNRMAKATMGRNIVYNQTLNTIGADIAQGVAEIRATYVNDQEELGASLTASSKTAIRSMLIIASIALVIGIGFATLLTRAITGPIRKTAAFAQTMAGGNFTTKLAVDQRDEIGDMAGALNMMVGQLGSMIQELITGISKLSMSSTDLAAVSQQLSSSAKNTADKSVAVAAATEEMSTNIQSVSSAMEQSTGNVNMIASSTEEMTATVHEIAESAEKARTITDKAVQQSQQTTEKMAELGESATKIGRVTETITEISEQTNLLALNATIEAARAGEAGKGFAVVANEIKELARQTAEATVDIKNQIAEMQTTTNLTIEDIGQISEVILEINMVINAIASAVEEQSAATTEISGNIAQTSTGIGEVNDNVAQSSMVVADITKNVQEISHQSSQVGDGSAQVQASAQSLSDLASQLEIMVKKFKV